MCGSGFVRRPPGSCEATGPLALVGMLIPDAPPKAWSTGDAQVAGAPHLDAHEPMPGCAHQPAGHTHRKETTMAAQEEDGPDPVGGPAPAGGAAPAEHAGGAAPA